METLCRKCGSEIAAMEFCEGCDEAISWICGSCERRKESPHLHRAVVQYVLAR